MKQEESKWKKIGKQVLKGAVHYGASKVLGTTIGEGAEAGYQGQYVKTDDQASADDTDYLAKIFDKDLEFKYKYGQDAPEAKKVGSFKWEKENTPEEITGYSLGSEFDRHKLYMPDFEGDARQQSPQKMAWLLNTYKDYKDKILNNPTFFDQMKTAYGSALNQMVYTEVDEKTGEPVLYEATEAGKELAKLHPEFKNMFDSVRGDMSKYEDGYMHPKSRQNGELRSSDLSEAEKSNADKQVEKNKNIKLWVENHRKRAEQLTLNPDLQINEGSSILKGFALAHNYDNVGEFWADTHHYPNKINLMRDYEVFSFLDEDEGAGAHGLAALYYYKKTQKNATTGELKYTWENELSLIDGLGAIDKYDVTTMGSQTRLRPKYKAPKNAGTLEAGAIDAMAKQKVGIDTGREMFAILDLVSGDDASAILGVPGGAKRLLDWFNPDLKGITQFKDVFNIGGEDNIFSSKYNTLEKKLNELKEFDPSTFKDKNARAAYGLLVKNLHNAMSERSLARDQLKNNRRYRELQKKLNSLSPEKRAEHIQSKAYYNELQHIANSAKDYQQAMWRAQFNTLRVMFAFQAAVALQGGSGGRTVSDQDYIRLEQALSITDWSTKRQAQKSIAGVVKFMESQRAQSYIISKYVKNGTHGVVSRRFNRIKNILTLSISPDGRSYAEPGDDFGNVIGGMESALQDRKDAEVLGIEQPLTDSIYSYIDGVVKMEDRAILGLGF